MPRGYGKFFPASVVYGMSLCDSKGDVEFRSRNRDTVSTHTDYNNGRRLRIRTPVEIHSQFREDVATGLQCPRKTIPPKYFYDAYGSLLFEQICQQPEYYLT